MIFNRRFLTRRLIIPERNDRMPTPKSFRFFGGKKVTEEKKVSQHIVTPRFILTLATAIIMLLVTLTIFLLQQTSDTSVTATAYLHVVTVAISLLCTVLIIITVIFGLYEANNSRHEAQKGNEQNRFPIGLIRKLEQPVAICEPSGRLVWGNTTFCKLVGETKVLNGSTLSSLFNYVGFSNTASNAKESSEQSNTVALPANQNELFKLMDERRFTLNAGCRRNGTTWLIHAYKYVSSGADYYMMVFTDYTELIMWKDNYLDDRAVVAYFVVDNLTELVSSEQEAYRIASAEINTKIRNWAQEHEALIKEYDREKYLVVFRNKELQELKVNKFAKLIESIREIKVGSEELSVTISGGVSDSDGSMSEKEHAAQAALDLALKRGGNQIIVHTAAEMFCFGARAMALQSRSNVHHRVFAETLKREMEEHDRVLIMGHKNPDFDAIGSCAGIARLALSLGKEVFIVMDDTDPNISECADALKTLPEYGNIFLSGLNGMDSNNDAGSMVVCCDVNNAKQIEVPELVKNANTLFIIDHHRQSENTPKSDPALGDKQKYNFLIVPSASSASELVTEILDFALPEGDCLTAVEADIMFAGMLLDTKQFTRNAQTDTFKAALYLREAGADPSRAQKFFKTDYSDFRLESEFCSDIKLMRDRVAIASAKADDVANATAKRTSAAKTADRLLNIKNIQASFVLAKMERDIFISARSDGTVNVQLIMEELGGGGHYNAAATLIKNISLDMAYKQLEEAIDKYFGKDQAGENKSNIKTIRDGFVALEYFSTEKPAVKRTSAEQTADQLLDIKNIDASFVFVKMGSDVFVSARSNPTTDVHSIMQELGGDGDGDATTVLLNSVTLEKAHKQLEEAMNKCLGEDQAEAYRSDITMLKEGIVALTDNGNEPQTTKCAYAETTAAQLLKIKNIKAAFVLTKTGNNVFIAARSAQTINIQPIIEELNDTNERKNDPQSNGTFTALMHGTSLDMAYKQLQKAIYKHLGRDKFDAKKLRWKFFKKIPEDNSGEAEQYRLMKKFSDLGTAKFRFSNKTNSGEVKEKTKKTMVRRLKTTADKTTNGKSTD